MARDALLDVTRAIDERASFLVEAGAGSGKTFALVHGLKHILGTARDELARGGKRVACITYTNVAKDEIRDRIAADPLVFVGTIHEFLWDVIEPYQAELKQELVVRNETARKPVENLSECLKDVPVQYSDRGRNWAAGRVVHDDVLELAEALFTSRPKLARLSADRFPFLFIDEYQDTTKGTVGPPATPACGRRWSTPPRTPPWTPPRAQNYPALLKAFEKAGSFGRDRLLQGNDPIAQALDQAEQICAAFTASDHGALMKLLSHSAARVTKHSDKSALSAKLGQLLSLRDNGTVGDVLQHAFTSELVGKSNSVRRLEESAASAEDERGVRDGEFLEAVRAVRYQEFVSFSEFRDERTPFSTQHGVKGAEFPNVIVAIEDPAWTQYNVGNLLAGYDSSPTRLERSRNLFYVCCSRPTSGLAVVFLSDPPDAAVATARDWFGADNTF